MTDTSLAERAASLDEQATALARCLAADATVISVAVLGSAARGECAWATVEGRRELLSDIELLAVTRDRLPSARRQALVADIRHVAASFGYRNPVFHVDVLFRSSGQLRAMPPFIFAFELAANGRTLAGLPMLGEVRRVHLGNLDRRNAHEILMKRLWALAEGLPAAWVRREPLDEMTAVALAGVLARQPLDLTTVLLPEAGVLRPTYVQRVSYWRAHPGLPFRAAIDSAHGGDSGSFLADCMARRQDLRPLARPAEAYAQVVTLLGASVAWLMGVPPASAADAAARESRRVFHERPVTVGEWIALAKQARDIAADAGAGRAVAWLAAPRKGLLASGLMHLHAALLARLSDERAESEEALGRALQAVAAIDDYGGPAGRSAEGAASGRTRADAGSPGPVRRPSSGPGASQVLGPAGNVAAAECDGPDGNGSRPVLDAFAERWLAARAVLGWQFWRSVRLGEEAAWQRIAEAVR